ncbi:MAG: ABC transporter substrate-binding protein [Clostridiales bacterium]|jgi:ABC-type transport system substrate-binding protein|nr:ABC transporter substrate-binding protein [Clostridiales bacterium]
MKRRRLLAFSLSIFMVASAIAGCSSSGLAGSDDPSPSNQSGSVTPSISELSNEVVDYSKNVTSDGKTFIRVGISADPGTFDPLVGSNSTGRQYALNPMAQHLLTSNFDMELFGELAKSWDKIDDFTYIIQIHDNITDSDGNHLTSADVVWCYEQAKESGIGQSKNISSIKALDDYNIEFILDVDTITIFQSVMRRINIVTKKAYEDSPNKMATTPVMTGPYVLKEYIPDSKIVVEKRDDYWKTNEAERCFTEYANADIIEFHVIKEPAQLAIALESGQIDMVYGLDTMNASRFMDGESPKEGFNRFISKTSSVILLFLNCSAQSVFKDNLALRQAILYSFDSQAIADGAYSGGAVPCKAFGSSILPDYLDEWESDDYDYYNYNVDKAKELVAQSGYKNDEVINIMVDSDSQRKMVAQILQNYLLAIDVKTEISSYDQTLFDTYADDPAKWDIRVDSGSSSDYLASMLDGRFNANKFTEGMYNESFAQDDKLQELVIAANDPKSFNSETVGALVSYLNEQAYAVGLVNLVLETVTTDVVEDIVLTFMPNILPSSCWFVWNKR